MTIFLNFLMLYKLQNNFHCFVIGTLLIFQRGYQYILFDKLPYQAEYLVLKSCFVGDHGSPVLCELPCLLGER